MFGLGIPELTIIVIAVIILFFGGNKLNEFARGIGRFSGEFKKGKKEIEEELKMAEKEEKKAK